jgi:probable phosphoglycerate mutase
MTIDTELVVIRHGETLWNSEHRMQGQQDSALSEIGRAQARALGKRMQTERFTHLYSSDLTRAFETAKAVADVTGHEIRIDTRLRERSFGIFEGLTRAEMAERHPEEYARFRARDPDYALPGGESPRAFHERCMGCFTEIANRHRGERVVVVAHGLLLASLYRVVHGLDLQQPRTLDLINAGLNIFRYGESRWHILTWADQTHLQDSTLSTQSHM